MSHEILINVTPQETRVAMLEQGVVQELHIERSSARGLVGNIYVGRVARVLPGMQSAFVEIGLERAAFLHIADIWEHRQNGHSHENRPIERIVHEGQSLVVQVIKDPIGTKGARPPRSQSCRAPARYCRRIRISAFRSASRTRPSAKACAAGCSSSFRRDLPEASSSAPWRRPQPNASCKTTSNI